MDTHCTLAYSMYLIEGPRRATERKIQSFNPNLAYVKHILIVDDSALIRRSLRTPIGRLP